MCGIAGRIGSYNGEENLKGILALQSRRGPDQDGIYQDREAALLHNRLAVIDIENGKQPMAFSQGNRHFVLVYNGELYNTEEIRGELKNKGYHFRGHSDTEVLLKAYVEWGKDCLQKFNGIFAFAVWEGHNRRLFFARDRMGVKPFFYATPGGLFLFASEIKALLAHPALTATIDAKGIAEIMLIGPGRTPGCGVFQDVVELPPAHYGYYKDGKKEIHRYWDLEDREHTDSFEETVEKTRFLVTDAIKRQLVSDVPLGTFLSGGLDSSIISAIAAGVYKEEEKKLHTFSVNYRDNEKYFQKSKFQPNSDEFYIKQMCDHIGAENTEVIIDTPQLVQGLFEAVEARDLPGMADVDASLLLFCREIKKTDTVALSGECADEIFGGYPWFTDPDIRAKNGFPWAQSTAYRAGFLRQEWQEKIDAESYVGRRYERSLAKTSKCPGLSRTEARMKEMVRLNMDWFMQTLLDRKDRMSMYSGLEVRVPFCDYRIAEYLYGVPWDYKHYRGMEKGLLREAMKGLLPDEVLWRKKSPYPKTHHPSYLQAVSDLLRERIADGKRPLLEIVTKESLTALLSSPHGNDQPWYGQLMMKPQTIAYLLQVDYWLEKYQVRLV